VPQPNESAAPPGYELLGELGKGTFGTVYKARDLKLKRVVALKVMRPDVDRRHLPRFLFEAEAVARMQHPNIVQIFEVGEFQGRYFCALEYVDGGSLDRMLGGQPLPPRQAADLVQELALAMHYAHQQGVIHRDLKPGNLLFRRSQPGPQEGDVSVMLKAGRLKITDFGLAKRLDDDAGHTVAGALIGTPSYMAPEQAEGKDVGPVADVWALGAILYEMLTGRPPFMGKGVYETLQMVRYDEPVPPRKRVRKVPRDLETICLKCLRKEPARRYASALELAADLARFRAGEPIAARPVGRAERLARLFLRYPAVSALASAAALLLVVGLIVTTTLYFRAEDQRRAADQARQRAEAATIRANQLAAEAQTQRKAAERQAAHARQVSRMLTGMFDASDPLGLNGYTSGTYNRPRESLKARDLLDRAVKLVGSETGLDPAVKASVYHDVGNAYRSLGLHNKAEPLLREALEIRLRLGAPDNEVADTLHVLAWVHHQRGDYLSAEKGYQESLARRKRSARPNETARLNTMLNLGWLYIEMDEAETGLEYCKAVLQGRVQHFGETHRETALARASLAGAYLKLNRPREAGPHMARALKDLEDAGIDKDVIQAATKLQAGVIQDMLFRDLDQAIKLMGESVTLMRQLDQKHVYVMLPLVQLADLEVKRGQFDPASLKIAFTHYEEAFKIGEEAVGLAHPQMLVIGERLAGLQRRLGRPEQGAATLKRLLDANRERFGKDHVFVGDALVAAARHERELGKPAEAQARYEEAEKIYARFPRLPRRHGNCLLEMGFYLFLLRKFPDSEQVFRKGLKVQQRLHKGAHAEVVAVTANLLSALNAQNKYDKEFAQLLADMDRQIEELPHSQRPSLRVAWVTLSARLQCHERNHRKAADQLGQLAANARAPGEHLEMARAYVVCLAALDREAVGEASERAQLRERYAGAAVEQLRLWWKCDATAPRLWAAAEWAPLRGASAFQDLCRQAGVALPK
jgi:tetratricopeptide (TPR) repeat protein